MVHSADVPIITEGKEVLNDCTCVACGSWELFIIIYQFFEKIL